MKAEELERAPESGGGATEYLKRSNAGCSGQGQKRVDIDVPDWMIHALDKEAKRLGLSRQSLLKTVVAQHLNDKTT